MNEVQGEKEFRIMDQALSNLKKIERETPTDFERILCQSISGGSVNLAGVTNNDSWR